MTEAELSKIKGVGDLSIAEIVRVNKGGSSFPVPDDAPIDDTDVPIMPTPEMSIVNIADYEDAESMEGKDLYIVALKPHTTKWLKLFAIEFCARRRIEDLNYGLAIEGVIRKQQSEYPMAEQAQAAEDSPVAQRV